MAYKDILVHVDTSKNCADRLDAVIPLAQKHGAHVIGMFVSAPLSVPQYIRAQIGPKVMEAQRLALLKMADNAATAFRKKMEQTDISFEWRAVEGDPYEALSLSARYTDLVVLGQYDPHDNDAPEPSDLPDRMVLSAGCPVLVTPYAGRHVGFGKRIMVAWNAGRQAARAVNDALPLLREADHVEVLVVNPQDSDGNGSHGDVAGADIALHLARHGVNAEAQHIISRDVDPANMLLSRITDESIDTLVMGAYGHRRLRELVLGGVTREILRHMTVPVFMSH